MNLENLKKRVCKRYPGSIAAMDMDGEYYIVHNDTSLNETFMVPGCDTEIAAWHMISQFVQVEQSINRTHPLKQMISEQKKQQNQERIANRIHGR